MKKDESKSESRWEGEKTVKEAKCVGGGVAHIKVFIIIIIIIIIRYQFQEGIIVILRGAPPRGLGLGIVVQVSGPMI